MDTETARRALAQHLEALQRAGVRWLSVPELPAPSAMPAPTAAPAHSATARSATAAAAPAPAAPEEAVHEKGASEASVPAISTHPSKASSPAAADVAASSRPAPTEPASPAPASPASAPASLSTETAMPRRSPAATDSIEQRRRQLEAICRDVAGCTRCGELVANRTQTVFGVGNPRPRLCFLGEAPGADEDRQGEPFVGRAGQLLNKIIAACTLSREDVYILNILKCRPPGNRNPKPEEAENCREYLDRQLDVLQPEFICCLGAVAAQNLLETTQPIGRLRGHFHDYRGIRVIATYHPAYLLRNPPAKRHTWEDMQMLMRAMGIKLPK